MKSSSFEQGLNQRGITRREFLKFCTVMTGTLALPHTFGAQIAKALQASQRTPVVWLEFQDCAGCTESFLRASQPTTSEVVLDVLSVAVLLGILTWRALKRPVPMKLLSGLARVAAILLVLYLALKLGDLLVAGELNLIFESGGFSLVWLAEVLIGVIVPLVIFGTRAREKENNLLLGAVFVVVGLAINRWTQAWFALAAPPGATYAPTG